jgi:D-glycero-alpha-D-manno-heptose-7-phosphate kinase
VTVIARAPLRIGLSGGGTDLPAYADRFGGLVVSTTIDRYVYVIMTEAPDDVLQITAADANSVFSQHDHLFDGSLFWGADYRLPREILDYFGVSRGRRFFIASEVPPGTGLGSSSATAVAMIMAMNVDMRLSLNKRQMAEIACHIEIECMNMPIGRQDQYAAAFGGLNRIEFHQSGTEVFPMDVSESHYRELQECVLLFFTGSRRRSTDILTKQMQATKRDGSDTLHALHEIKALAEEMHAAIERGDLREVGHLLDASWQQKRGLAPGVTNSEIDYWYQSARDAGALGGKITGAGGGGFLMLYAEPEYRKQVIQQMSELGLVWVDTAFDRDGASSVMPVVTGSLVTAD